MKRPETGGGRGGEIGRLTVLALGLFVDYSFILFGGPRRANRGTRRLGPTGLEKPK